MTNTTKNWTCIDCDESFGAVTELDAHLRRRAWSGRPAAALKLRAAWLDAVDAVSRDPFGSDRLTLAEEAAYDELVEFVDDNGLTYTHLDPRGTLAEYKAEHPED